MALLSGLAEGRIVLALEGGFNLTTISYCMTLCAKALLGDLLPPLEPQLVPNKSAVQTTNGVIRTHSRYWLALCFKLASSQTTTPTAPCSPAASPTTTSM